MATLAPPITATAPVSTLVRQNELPLIVMPALFAVAMATAIMQLSINLPILIALNLWVFSYPHNISTLTRACRTAESTWRYRWYLASVLVIFIICMEIALSVGIWALAAIYFYWQWFHYVRQSWGIARYFQRQESALITEDPRLLYAAFYLLPIWGLLARSSRGEDTYLDLPVKYIPVPGWLVSGVAALAIAGLLWLVVSRIAMWRAGAFPRAHTAYLVSHFGILSLGYLIIPDTTTGWLTMSVWHCSQYLYFVWWFQRQEAAGKFGPAPEAPMFEIPTNLAVFWVLCGISAGAFYWGSNALTKHWVIEFVPFTLLLFISLAFHHYFLDGALWKRPTKPVAVIS